ncbi:MAG TPA: TlpA disulfide reductase family protein [Kofleriaceae bacterium]|jgi:thiol-disulfide isomerase/thioredoxin
MRAAVLALALVLSLGACTKLPEGDIAASLTATSVSGVPFDPASLKGKPSIVLFVSPTCPYCRAELPMAESAAKATGATAVAVFVAGKKANAQGVLTSAHFSSPALIDDTGALKQRYDITKVPYAIVLAADGHAVDQFHGQQDEATLRRALDEAR